jgi:HlyD family secretion protein
VRLRRWLVWIAVLAAVVVLVAWGFRPRPVLVETATVRRGPMRVTVEEEGKARVTDRYVVSAPVAGFARRIELDVGDTVQTGQVLAVLDPPRPAALDPRSRAEARARVSAAEAALSAARERLKAAAADAAYWEGQLARIQALVKTGDVSKESYDRAATEAGRAEAAHRSAGDAVEQAQAELASARATLEISPAQPANAPAEQVRVRAPASGRLLKLIRESEGVVTPGEPLVEIGNARSLEVEVEVLSAAAVRIRPGDRVLFERWGGGLPLEGRVRRVEPVAFTKISALGVEEQRVLVIVDITSPPEQWSRLGAGYRVEASFVLWESPDVLQVPASALFRYQDGWAVFTIEDGIARRRVVEVGQRTGLTAQVISGLAAGEQVIQHPDTSIEDGTAVAPRG